MCCISPSHAYMPYTNNVTKLHSSFSITWLDVQNDLVETHVVLLRYPGSIPIKMLTPINAFISSGVVGYQFVSGLDTCFSCAYWLVSSTKRSKKEGSQHSPKKSSWVCSFITQMTSVLHLYLIQIHHLVRLHTYLRWLLYSLYSCHSYRVTTFWCQPSANTWSLLPSYFSM